MLNDKLGFLLDYCSKDPEKFNKVANKLWEEFGIRSAEIALLITYITMEVGKDG